MGLMETQARVLAVDDDGHAWVEPRPHSPCGQCDPVHGCRSLSIARMFSGRESRFRVLNTVNARPGDWVTVCVPERSVLTSAALLYGLPLLALLGGALMGAVVNEAASVAAGLSCLLLSLWAVRRLSSRLSGDARFVPHVASRLEPDQLEKNRTCRSRK